MKTKKLVVGSLFLLVAPAMAGELNYITKFISPEVEVCNGPGEESLCTYLDRNDLPDPVSEKIVILNITEQGMVKLNINGEIRYIHQMDLEFYAKPTVAVKCRDTLFSPTSERRAYATHGIKEECNEKGQ